MHVLYVTVDGDAASEAREALDDAGATVTEVETISAALEALDLADPDCLVSNHDLPDGATRTLLERARTVDPDVPIVVHTDAGNESLAGELLAAGVDAYVPAGDGPAVLVERVEALVRVDRDPRSRPTDATAGRLSLLAEQTGALQETTRAMMAAGTRGEIAEEIVDAAEEILGQPVASVRLYDPFTEALETVAMTDRSANLVSDVVDEPPPVGPGAGRVWSVFESGEPTVVESLASEDTVYGEDLPVESLLFQPLGDHGVLVFGADDSAAFDETDVDLAGVLATTAAVAMDGTVRARELEQAETMLDAAGDGVFALDEDGLYVQFNDRFVEMVGRSSEELWGSRPSLFSTDEDEPKAENRVQDLFEGDADVVTYEATISRPDGSTLPVEINQSLLPGDGFVGTVGTVRDITEHKRMEAALRERKEKIERLHDVATRLDACEDEAEICQIAVDAAEGILNFENCAVRLADGNQLVLTAGTFDDDLAERHGVDQGIIGRTYRTGDTTVVADAREDGDALQNPWGYRSVLSVPLGDHGVLQTFTTTVDAYDEEDAELAELLAAHATDALERVTFEAELRSERDRMAALFDNVPDPVVSVHHPGDGPVVRSVNRAFEELFGYDAAEIGDESIDEYIVPPGDMEEACRLNERGQDGELVVREVRRRTADGLRDFVLTVVPVDLDEESPATFGVYTDVTERKQRRERVEVLNRVLRHDLRNGMNIVRGAAEMLIDRVDGEAAEYAESIVDQAEQLLVLADRTRAVERAFDRDGGPSEPLDVASLLDGAVSDIDGQYPAADVSFVRPSASAVVRGGSLLELALVDVLENAVVHSDRASPRVEVGVEVDDEDVVVRVADDGPGIPEDVRRLLTGEEKITQLRHASGLGLWLVNWAVTHAGGELTFDDNEPRGSVVTMRLPQADVGARPPSVGGD